MDTKRLLRTSGTVLAVAGLLLSACTSSGEERASASTPSVNFLAALPTDTPAALKPYYEQRLAWRDCYGDGFQCATMKVPLDYDHPVAADDLTLQVQRKRATDTARRLGSLLVNPGGPGGSAIDYLHYAATSVGFPAPVTSRYDMTAVDPRGVGRSEPVTCLTGEQMDDFTSTDTTPDTTSEISRLVTADTAFGKGCQESSGKLLGHVSTIDAARDMDVLRALVGDRKLNYVGKSYGTFLGATYAGLFPQRVGRLVLDGAMDPSVSALEASRGQAGGFETAFTAFAKDCVLRADCALGTKSAAEAGTRLDRFFTALDTQPLPTGTDRRLDEPLATTGVIAAMYSEAMWPTLRAALKQAVNDGDGSALLRLSDSYYERDADGSYGNLMYANAAVNCLDLPPALSSPAEAEAAAPSFRKASPHFGETLAWSSLLCGYWPIRATGEPRRIEAKGAAPIVVVGTTRDPATPYAWAVSLADQLASGVLLSYDGDGHTAYGRGSDCVDTAVNAYLLDGRAPANGKECS